MPELWVCDLGVIEYGAALALQNRLHQARVSGLIPDTLLLLEHEPVYTRGRRAGPGELPLGAEFYAQRGIAIFDTDRGGKVTYHGPGQLVGYPIVAVSDIGAYVRTLEGALIGALAHEGVSARARVQDGPSYTGVWVQERKIASIGVHIARGVATHGFAVNIDNDLAPFEWVVACGLPEVRMTSLALETGRSDLLTEFRREAARQLAQALGLNPRSTTLADLEAQVSLAGAA
jgi:lipoyl(octanoyl) transferase